MPGFDSNQPTLDGLTDITAGPTMVAEAAIAMTLEAAARPSVSGSDLGEPAGGLGGDASGDPGGELPERLGRYFVLDRLGEGGMGVVFTAYDPELDRKVAIKLLRSSATHSGQDRLLREAQAMAKLSHPNVVPVFDVGQFRGRVFLAMDYVVGHDLRAWLGQGHAWREVLDVFMAAGRGLAHAHAHDLIHRDFKPDNVLVSEHDGERRVQVLDFGLAKSVIGDGLIEPTDGANGPESELSTFAGNHAVGHGHDSVRSYGSVGDNSKLSAELTHAGAILGTPAYMSPEQHRGAPTTAATDQFSFCVALYEGLWGKRPFTGTTLKALAFAVVSGKIDPPPAGAKAPTWIWPILARGLDKDPAKRWPSMNALLAELAVDPTQRRRSLVIGIAGVTAFASAIAWGVLREPEVAVVVEAPPKCQGAGDRLAEVWNDAGEATIAQRYAKLEDAWANNVSAEVARQLDAWGGRWTGGRTQACEATEVRGEQSAELMDLRIACYDRKLAELAPVVELLTTGEVELLGKGVELVSNLPTLETCDDPDALRAEVPPPEDPAIAAEVAQIREQLASARSKSKAGQPKPALELVQPLVARAKATGYAPVMAEVELRLGALQIAVGDVDAGRLTLEAASMSAIATRDDNLAGIALEELVSQIGYTDGDYAGGMRWARLGQALLERAPQPSERRRAHLAVNVGMAEFQAGNFDAAREQITLALDLLGKLDGPDHPSLANAINVLGATYLRSGDYAKAGELFERSLAISERAYGPTHPQIAFSLNNLALVHERMAKFDEAADAFRRVIAIFEPAHGEGHPNVGLTRMNLGGILLLGGHLEEAGPELVRAIEILEASVGPEHQIVGRALTMRGDWERESGELETALATYQRSLKVRETALGKDHPDLSLSLLGTGRTLLALGRTRDAIRDLERALVLLDTPDADPIDRGVTRFHLARALAAADQRDRIPALLDAARADYETGGIRAKADLAELEAWASEPK